MLFHRNTPIDNALPSPAQILYRRKPRDTLPTQDAWNVPRNKEIRDLLIKRQAKQKEYHDSHGVRQLPKLQIGQRASLRDARTGLWSPVIVTDICDTPNSYAVQTPNGRTLRCNRMDLRELGKVPNVPKRVHFAPAPVVEKTEASGETRTKSGRKVVKPKRLIEEI